MSFQEIIEILNFLYSLGMLLEFAAFIKLRMKKPDLHRPYKVPLQTLGVTMLCLPPALLLLLVMCLASLKTFLVSGAISVIGIFLYPTLVQAKDKKWVQFDTDVVAPQSDSCIEGHPTTLEEHRETDDEASISLLSDLPSAKTEQESSEILLVGVLKVE